MKTIATTLGIARSHLHDRLQRTDEPHPKPPKAEDAAVLQHIRRIVEERPTYGYRRITALLRREMARENGPPVNHKRVFRIMRQHGLLLARHTAERPGRTHDGKVIVMRSNLRWCSDNGSPYTAKETRIFAQALNLTPCFTPVASPESNGLSEAFVKTFKHDYVRVHPLPDAKAALSLIAGWIEDYNEMHPHSGLRMRSPREFRRAQS